MPKATEQEYRTAIMASTDQELLPLLAQLSTICKTIPQHNNTINLWLCAKHDPLQWQINSSELQIELITLSLPFFLLTAFMLYGLVLLYRQQRHTLQLLEQQRDRHFENSRTDPLTGAYSRAAFNALYSAVESHYHRNNLRFALFYVDIDHFKNINDQHGHDIGDQVLSVVTSCLQHAIRPNDYLVRLGGDEFAVIGNFTEQGQAQVMAEKLRELVMLLHFRAASGEEFSISISIGCYLVSKRDTMLSAQKHADQALYIAKRRGRNQVYCFSAEAVEQLVTSVGNDTFTQP
jgi:diguanylate cyclase (GGDEF)-like protein